MRLPLRIDDLISYVLENDEMDLLLEGVGDYHHENRDENGAWHVDYENWFKHFAWYERNHPQTGMTEAVSRALRKMLASASGMSNFCAIDFLATYRWCSFRDGFTLPDQEELTALAVSVLVERYDKLASHLSIFSRESTFPDHLLSSMYNHLTHPAAAGEPPKQPAPHVPSSAAPRPRPVPVVSKPASQTAMYRPRFIGACRVFVNRPEDPLCETVRIDRSGVLAIERYDIRLDSYTTHDRRYEGRTSITSLEMIRVLEDVFGPDVRHDFPYTNEVFWRA